MIRARMLAGNMTVPTGTVGTLYFCGIQQCWMFYPEGCGDAFACDREDFEIIEPKARPEWVQRVQSRLDHEQAKLAPEEPTA